MKNIIIALLLVSSAPLMAQIGGLSASKLSSLTVDVVNHKKVEFEPGFFHARASKYWNQDRVLKNYYSTSDSLRMLTGMYFRFTYGLWNNLEMGVSLSSDMSLSQWGMRYVVMQKKNIALAAIAGLNIPLGNTPVDKRLRAGSNSSQAGIGVVGSLFSDKNLSLDFTAEYMHFIDQQFAQDKGGLYLSLDVGYYIWDRQLQLIGAASYQNVDSREGTHEVLTLYPGITIETGKDYIIVLAFPFDVYGRREAKNTWINFALTLTFD